jgi:hypothetical protein
MTSKILNADGSVDTKQVKKDIKFFTKEIIRLQKESREIRGTVEGLFYAQALLNYAELKETSFEDCFEAAKGKHAGYSVSPRLPNYKTTKIN